jgi:putative transcriptional regulator
MPKLSAKERVFYKHVGDRLRELRRIGKQKPITQSQLARGIGVMPNTVCRWETGEYRPTLFDALRVARFFDVSIEVLIEDFKFQGEAMRPNELVKEEVYERSGQSMRREVDFILDDGSRVIVSAIYRPISEMTLKKRKRCTRISNARDAGCRDPFTVWMVAGIGQVGTADLISREFSLTGPGEGNKPAESSS